MPISPDGTITAAASEQPVNLTRVLTEIRYESDVPAVIHGLLTSAFAQLLTQLEDQARDDIGVELDIHFYTNLGAGQKETPATAPEGGEQDGGSI